MGYILLSALQEEAKTNTVKSLPTTLYQSCIFISRKSIFITGLGARKHLNKRILSTSDKIVSKPFLTQISLEER